MNKIYLIIIILCLSANIQAQWQRPTNYIIAIQHDMLGHVGIDVGDLKANNVYSGMQGTIPYNTTNKEYYLNYVYGYGINIIPSNTMIFTGILGLHTNDFIETVHFNYGCGFTIVNENKIVIGISYTNKQLFTAKIGFKFTL